MDADGKKAFENNAKAMKAILCDWAEIELVKVMHRNTAE